MDSSGTFVAPDGGVRAWMVMTASFLINGVIFGVINSYSVLNLVFLAELQDKGDSNARSKAALVGVLAIAATFFLSSISGVLTNFMGIRTTAVIGGLFTSAAMLLSSFMEYNLEVLCFTYGILFGFGAALCYTPSLAILGHYFSKHLGLVNGIVSSGSSIFTIFMPALLEAMISTTNLASTFRLLALIMSVNVFVSLLFKPLRPVEKVQYTDSFKEIVMKNVINVEIWSCKRYVIWAASVAVACSGYFVPYVHMGAFVAKQFPGSNKSLPIQCIGVTSLLGRITFGFLADRPKINRIMLQQIAFASIGLLTVTLPFITSFPFLCVATLGMGLFDGAFISLLGPIAFDLLGPKNAGQGIGCLLGMASIPMSLGPPFAAYLNTKLNDFTVPFALAGLSPIIGSMMLCSFRCISKPAEDDEEVVAEAQKLNGFSSKRKSDAGLERAESQVTRSMLDGK